ncbi:peptidase M50 [Alkaliphilus metalliredigens QYMF]|uniref:Peptidase M50 n=1 Tax=Alkaliphilus metalliredigens (strain QYMF) TaxID=293826 RepID=A6TQI8_ALKMQ|nr:M50 family metallopeptidase [Alkaliphilus metalliredigens]ABR48456.1 peptidase M50 [Alkaliphilus metalliredigens QYMF]
MNLFIIKGIKIKINFLLFPFLFISLLMGYLLELTTIMIIITIHELSHSLISSYYDIPVTEIELFPFGGVARTTYYLEKKPREETIIALAGPLSNIVLFILAKAIGKYIESPIGIYEFFLYANLSIGLFNLIPILPLDGGRILRSNLTTYFGIKKATTVMIYLSKVCSMILFLLGLWFSIKDIRYVYIILLAIFIWMRVEQQDEMLDYIVMQEMISKKVNLLQLGKMEAKYIVALEFLTLKEIYHEFKVDKYYIVTVINTKGEVIGQLTESQVLQGMVEATVNTSLETLLVSLSKGKELNKVFSND